MLTVAVVVAWLAAAYRLAVSWTQPRTVWRTSFTAVMLAVAVSFTLYWLREPIDGMFGEPNLSGLLSRLVISVGMGFLLVYLHALRGVDVPRQDLIGYLLITSAVAVTLTISWSLAPIHQREMEDLLPARSVATAIYCLTYWAFIALALAMTAWTCLRRRRTVRHRDLAREISLLFIAGAAVAGLVVMIAWSLSLVLTFTGADGSDANRVGDLLIPIPAVLVSIGVICLLVVPYLHSLLLTWRRWRALRPLWSALVQRYPDVHLDAPARGGILTRLQFRVERMIIETLDALRIAPVVGSCTDVDAVDAVARAIADGVAIGSDLHAAELLDHSGSRDDDVDQLIRLADAYERLQRASA